MKKVGMVETGTNPKCALCTKHVPSAVGLLSAALVPAQQERLRTTAEKGRH